MSAAAVPAEKPAAQPAPTPIAAVDPLSFVDDAAAFSAATLAILASPVDPEIVEERAVKEGSDRTLLYVPWVHYQAVLLKAFGPGGYRLVPRGVPRTEGNVITWHGALFVRAPGDTKFQFIKEAKGECKVTGAMTAGNLAEGAQSDCLTKCCKGLGIFMELFDPRWRRAWEDKYKGKHQQNVRAAQWPKARPAPAADAPPATVTGASTTAPTTPATITSPAPLAEEPAAPELASDTGEAATAEQKEALKSKIRDLKWKRGYVRLWFAGLFGDAVKCDDPLEALTSQQADVAYFLVLAHGKPLYDKLLADERAKGNVL